MLGIYVLSLIPFLWSNRRISDEEATNVNITLFKEAHDVDDHVDTTSR